MNWTDLQIPDSWKKPCSKCGAEHGGHVTGWSFRSDGSVSCYACTLPSDFKKNCLEGKFSC